QTALSSEHEIMEHALTLHPLLADRHVRGLVFDLDGTLIHSAPDILHSIRVTLEHAGFGKLPEDYFPDNLHSTSMGILRDIMLDMGWTVPGDFSSLRREYLANYRALGHRNTRLYPDVQEFLYACKEAGFSLAICTNKVRDLAISALGQRPPGGYNSKVIPFSSIRLRKAARAR